VHPLLRAAFCLLLAAAYTLSAVSPCGPVLEDRSARPPFAASAERISAWEADAAQQKVTAACPCGCPRKSPVRSGGSAGFALLRPAPEPVFQPASFEIASSPPASPAAPYRDVDPAPI
jgi:hypothetical protein